MKIGFFLQNIKKGGLDTFIIQLLKHWDEGDSIVLFCNNSHPGLESIRKKVPKFVKVFTYDFLVLQDFDSKYQKLPIFIYWIFKNTFRTIGIIYQTIILKKIFSTVKLDRLMVINGGYPGGDACQAATIAWGWLYPGKLSWHNFHSMAPPYSKSIFRSLRERLIDKLIAQSSCRFVTVSKSCKKSLSNHSILNKIQREYIYNGISLLKPKNNNNIRTELMLTQETILILMLATYDSYKGHSFIFKVMERVVTQDSNAHLIVCGDGSSDEFKKVKDELKNSNVQTNIHLQGYRPDIENLFAQIDLLVVPSQAYESFGYTALEAMCCKVPVVATNVGGLPEVVEDGASGFIVSRENDIKFSECILLLIKDKEIRNKMGNYGYKRFRKH